MKRHKYLLLMNILMLFSACYGIFLALQARAITNEFRPLAEIFGLDLSGMQQGVTLFLLGSSMSFLVGLAGIAVSRRNKHFLVLALFAFLSLLISVAGKIVFLLNAGHLSLGMVTVGLVFPLIFIIATIISLRMSKKRA